VRQTFFAGNKKSFTFAPDKSTHEDTKHTTMVVAQQRFCCDCGIVYVAFME